VGRHTTNWINGSFGVENRTFLTQMHNHSQWRIILSLLITNNIERMTELAHKGQESHNQAWLDFIGSSNYFMTLKLIGELTVIIEFKYLCLFSFCVCFIGKHRIPTNTNFIWKSKKYFVRWQPSVSLYARSTSYSCGYNANDVNPCRDKYGNYC
jgi:hypothetical protein